MLQEVPADLQSPVKCVLPHTDLPALPEGTSIFKTLVVWPAMKTGLSTPHISVLPGVSSYTNDCISGASL